MLYFLLCRQQMSVLTTAVHILFCINLIFLLQTSIRLKPSNQGQRCISLHSIHLLTRHTEWACWLALCYLYLVAERFFRPRDEKDVSFLLLIGYAQAGKFRWCGDKFLEHVVWIKYVISVFLGWILNPPKHASSWPVIFHTQHLSH